VEPTTESDAGVAQPVVKGKDEEDDEEDDDDDEDVSKYKLDSDEEVGTDVPFIFQ